MRTLRVNRAALKRHLNIDVRVEVPTRKGARYGYWQPGTGVLVVSPRQPVIGQHVTLLHELFHALDDLMLQNKIIRRRSDHRWIDSAATNLLAMLVLLGIYRGVTKRQMLRFMRQHVPDAPGRRRRRT